jgi:hypothetical protein
MYGGEDLSGRNNFLCKACKPCKERREKWGGDTTVFNFEKRKAQEQAQTLAQAHANAYVVTPEGSEMKAWLLSIGLEEISLNDIILQFLKPEYGVKTLRELFALEDEDIDEILQGLPLAKKKLLQKSIKQAIYG